MKKICFVVAEAGTAKSFLKDHISALSEEHDITLVGNFKDCKDITTLKVNRVYSINIQRKISISKDIMSLVCLYKLFIQERFDAVHSVTPKAGLLTAIASFFARIPNRIHIYTGQVWATKKGMTKRLLKTLDKTIALLDNHILVDGKSQRNFLIHNNIIDAENSEVLGGGSICGVNTNRFYPLEDMRDKMRSSIEIDKDKIVFVFLGRLNKEKGVFELFEAFNRLAKDNINAYLLLIGSDEENCLSTIANHSNIIDGTNFKFYGLTPTPETVLQAGDIFCLPSYREGFGSSVIEASCLGLPVICSDAYGLQDAYIDGVTGLKCKVEDVDSLYTKMKLLYDDETMRQEYGQNGRNRVLREFSNEKISKAWVEFYRSIFL